MSAPQWICEEARQFYEYLTLRGRSHITAYNAAARVHHFLEWVKKPVDRVTRHDIMRYLMFLKTQKGYRDSTLKNISYSLSQFLEFMGRKSLAAWVPRPVPKAKEIEWLPEDVIMSVVDRDPILRVAYELALRVSELLMLKRSEYNRETGEIAVYREKHKGKPNRYLLKLSDEARQLLNMYLDANSCSDDRVFCISRRAIQARFKRALKRAGLDPNKYTFHSIRHSRCTNLVIKMLRERGTVDLVTLAKFMGHLSPATTMQYIHIATRVLGIETPIEMPVPKLE
jgi:integrase